MQGIIEEILNNTDEDIKTVEIKIDTLLDSSGQTFVDLIM